MHVIEAIIGFFEMLIFIAENPKILLVLVPACIIIYLCVVFF